MANKSKKSGNLIAGTIAIVLAVALVIAYVITSSVKGTWSPLEWLPQEYSGHLNVDPGDATDDPAQTTSFTIGETTLSTPGDNFTFAADDETDYIAASDEALGTPVVTENPEITLSFPGDIISVGSPYPILSSFCMKDCFYTVLGAGNVNYSPLLDDAEKYFNDGIPLFIITFTDSDITFGILVDVSTFEPGEPEPW